MDRFKEIFELIRSKANSGTAAELSWVFFGQLLNVGLGFVILKLLSKMGTSDYGIYALIITISSLLVLVIYGPVMQGFLRFYYYYLERNLLHVYHKILYRALLTTGIFFFLTAVLLLALSFYINFNLPSLLFLFAGIFIIATRTGEFFNSFLNIIRKRKQNSILQGAERLAMTIVLLLLLFSENFNLTIILACFSIVVSMFTFIKIKVYLNCIPDEQKIAGTDDSTAKEIKSTILTYVIPFLLWGVAGWLQLNGEKWIIADLLSTSEVGIYAIMMSLVSALIAVPNTIITEFTTPIIYQNYADLSDFKRIKKGYSYIKLNTFVIMLVTLAATAITAVLGEEIIILISSPDYAVYWYLLPLLCLGMGIFYTGQTLIILGLALNQPAKYISPKITTGIFSIVLNFILIGEYGVAGAAYTMVGAGIIYLAYTYMVNKKIISTLEVKL